MDESAARIYALLDQEPMDMDKLKLFACMDPKQLTKSFGFLLENLYVTALANGKVLNPNWSTYQYATTREWEEAVGQPDTKENSRDVLQKILLQTMPETESDRFVK